MQETVLERCLTGMTPREWYETLNRGSSSGWTGSASSSCSARGPTGTGRAWYSSWTPRGCCGGTGDVTLSAINSGYVRDEPGHRGPGTFRRIEGHPGDRAVVELAMDHAVPGAADLTTRVIRRRSGEELGELWREG